MLDRLSSLLAWGRGHRRLGITLVTVIAALMLMRVSTFVPGLPVGAQEAIESTMNPIRGRNLGAIAEIAARIESDTGFPAEVMIAQWALESNWGERPACHQNYFGMKKAGRHKIGCSAKTMEVFSEPRLQQWNRAHPSRAPLTGTPDGDKFLVRTTQQFADYASLEESCRDYAWLIMNGGPYTEVWGGYEKSRDVKGLLRSLAGVYWTDPAYVEKAAGVIAQGDVREALAVARGMDLPSAPQGGPRSIPPVAVTGLSIGLANLAMIALWYAYRAHSLRRHTEFKDKVESIRSSLDVKLAEALQTNNLDLMERFNGRYLQTTRFDKAHAEQIEEIAKITTALKSVTTMAPAGGLRLARTASST
jgi:Mannosyl-glycoprotein endo-beta-N-acetylglucosaminidase